MKTKILLFLSSFIFFYSCSGSNNTQTVNDTGLNDGSDKNSKKSTPEKTDAELVLGTWESIGNVRNERVVLIFRENGRFEEIGYEGNQKMIENAGEYNFRNGELVLSLDGDKYVIFNQIVSISSEKLVLFNKTDNRRGEFKKLN